MNLNFETTEELLKSETPIMCSVVLYFLYEMWMVVLQFNFHECVYHKRHTMNCVMKKHLDNISLYESYFQYYDSRAFNCSSLSLLWF